MYAYESLFVHISVTSRYQLQKNHHNILLSFMKVKCKISSYCTSEMARGIDVASLHVITATNNRIVGFELDL